MGTGLRRTVELVGVWTSLGMRDGVPLCGAGCRLATWIWQGFFRPPPHLWPGFWDEHQGAVRGARVVPKGRANWESSSARRWALSLKRAQEPPFVFPREALVFFRCTW